MELFGAILGIIVGAAFLRLLGSQAGGSATAHDDSWYQDYDATNESFKFDYWEKAEKEAINQDACYGNLGLGLGPPKLVDHDRYDHE